MNMQPSNLQYQASAPGTLMLLGEYAVLHGKQALVCAVDKRISVTLTPRTDKKVSLYSPLYGSYQTSLSSLKVEKPFHYILAVIQHFQSKFRFGCHIDITSEFSDKIGLGSSAAATVATFAAIAAWLNIKNSSLEMLRQVRQIIRTVQGTGSGADAAAAIYGGMVAYQSQPLFVEKLGSIHPLTVLYSGFKTPTGEAIKRVEKNFATRANLFRHLTNSIGQCALEGIQFVRNKNWQKLGEVMNIQQGLMDALGVNIEPLPDLIHELRKQAGIFGAKISGSGFGDCVIGLGNHEQYQYSGAHAGIQKIPVQMTNQGVFCEKN